MGPANVFVLDTNSKLTIKLKKEHLNIKLAIIWFHFLLKKHNINTFIPPQWRERVENLQFKGRRLQLYLDPLE